MPPKQHEPHQGPNPRTALVMVTFGRSKLLRLTLDTLFAYTDPEQVSITIVDNNSGSEVIKMLVEAKENIDRLVLLNNNWGKPYAWNVGAWGLGAWDLGASMAQEECKTLGYAPPTHFVFCDSDLEFREDWHEKMLASYEEHRKTIKLCALSGYKWEPHPLDLQTGTTTINKLRLCAGCCLMMSAEAYQDNGKWDTRRLIRTVDTSYLRNANCRGWVHAAVHPESVIAHTGAKQRSWQIGTGVPKLRP